MALRTKNFGLTKPQLSDPADITAFNANWDIIDEELVKAAQTGDSDDSDITGTEPAGEIEGDEPLIDPLVTAKIKEIVAESYVNKEDIVDNLTDTSTDKPLSANQGKVLNESLKMLESNFSTAADEIGAALVAKGCTVPQGTSLLEMATLISTLKVLSPSVATELLSVIFESSVGGGNVSSYYSSAKLGNVGNDITGGWSAVPYYSSGEVGNKTTSTVNYIDLTDVTLLSVDYGGHRTHSGASPNNYVYVNLIDEAGASTRIMEKQDIVDISKTTQDIDLSAYKGKYKIQIVCGVHTSVKYGVSGISFVSAIRVI